MTGTIHLPGHHNFFHIELEYCYISGTRVIWPSCFSHPFLFFLCLKRAYYKHYLERKQSREKKPRNCGVPSHGLHSNQVFHLLSYQSKVPVTDISPAKLCANDHSPLGLAAESVFNPPWCPPTKTIPGQLFYMDTLETISEILMKER